MNMPGFTAEASLSKHKTCYRMVAGGNRDGSSGVIPQFSCWRVCRAISSNHYQLTDCTRVCDQLKSIFLWPGTVSA